jgi:hypothetical protein
MKREKMIRTSMTFSFFFSTVFLLGPAGADDFLGGIVAHPS